MTPKEKAEEIYAKYGELLRKHNFRSIKAIKECALITVNEIIEAIDFDWVEIQNLENEHRYWELVKTEIENL